MVISPDRISTEEITPTLQKRLSTVFDDIHPPRSPEKRRKNVEFSKISQELFLRLVRSSSLIKIKGLVEEYPNQPVVLYLLPDSYVRKVSGSDQFGRKYRIDNGVKEPRVVKKEDISNYEQLADVPSISAKPTTIVFNDAEAQTFREYFEKYGKHELGEE